MTERRWTVHSGQGLLGPWGAEQIREELRSGRIDAFDLVAIEGSNLKQPLLEVDAIFETSRYQPAAMAEPSEVRPRAFEALASPESVAAASPLHKGQNAAHEVAAKNFVNPVLDGEGQRRFLIMQPRSQVKGPFSAFDILTLWYSQRLDPKSLVAKLGDSLFIPIPKFIRFYERALLKGDVSLDHVRRSYKMQSKMSHVLLLGVVFLMVFAGGLLVIKKRTGPNNLGLHEFARRHGLDDVLTAQMHDQPIPLPALAASPQQAPVVVPPTVIPLANPVVLSPRPSNPSSTVAPKKKSKPKVKHVNPSPPHHDTPSSPMPLPIIAQAPQKTTAPLPPPTKSPSAPHAPSPSWIDGRVETLTGYRYDPSALNTCTAKCKIPMKGPRGTVTVVFFKDAFAAAFHQKSTGLTITGTIKAPAPGQPVSLMLQKVN